MQRPTTKPLHAWAEGVMRKLRAVYIAPHTAQTGHHRRREKTASAIKEKAPRHGEDTARGQ